MRALMLAAAAALCAMIAAPPALAQDPYADGLLRRPGIDRLETSPVPRLRREARDWIAEERARQTAKPSELTELAVAIEYEIGPAIVRLAKRERVGSGDLILVVMYDIVAGAREAAEKELARLREAGAPAAEIEAAAAANARLDANFNDVVRGQTPVSRSLIPELAWSKR